MKKTVIYVKIALHFAKMKVVGLLPFAKGISAKIAIDPNIVIDPVVQSKLNQQIKDLDGTVTARETDLSVTLTKMEGKQATALTNTLTSIATTTEEQANDLTPGDVISIQTIITRIGYKLVKAAVMAGRSFEIFKTLKASVYIRIKADKTYNLYHWRWSADGVIWVRLQDTTVSNIIVFGLPEKKEAYFQSAVTLKVKGLPKLNAVPVEPEWGDIISELIP